MSAAALSLTYLPESRASVPPAVAGPARHRLRSADHRADYPSAAALLDDAYEQCLDRVLSSLWDHTISGTPLDEARSAANLLKEVAGGGANAISADLLLQAFDVAYGPASAPL